MSRIGLAPIKIPLGIDIVIDAGLIGFSSKDCASVSHSFPDADIVIEKHGDVLQLLPRVPIKSIKALLGLHRSLINNIVTGISQKFKKELLIVGVGYKAVLSKKYLIVSIGYSHDIYYLVPVGISFQIVKDSIIVTGVDKMLVGSVAHDLCSFRKFDPYKGKGIYHKGVFVLRKQAKKK